VIDVSGDQPASTEAKTTDTPPSNVIVGSKKEKRQCVELGFVDKLIELWKLRKRILENKTEITVSGFLARYNHDAGKAMMNNNEIVLYKALLFQCERDFDLMINVRLYQEIVIPNFTLRHGQFAAVAVVRSGANKLLKKVWETFITRRDKIIARDHAKVVQGQRKFDVQLQTAQMSAGQQIDKRIDEKFTNLSDTVKSIIKETVKQQYIKKESFTFDDSIFDDEAPQSGKQFKNPPRFQQRFSSSSSKRQRQQESIDLRSPNTPNQRKKKTESRPFSQNIQGVKSTKIFSKSKNMNNIFF